ncbi:hypothetical protein PPL_10275 [Heterostelium album PN500]|uniref:Coiled-coil domain-containing protein n=1 Tax=Heterostelium pallidum (strain ATCC 26659 / Pp 5 / PN500) TaxID=670386 RepID=D3BQT7_HETP5|nr:hypothetical protein PPL_10275 [Heterostelium album PN500]EFA76507.1 hypothetical protein PPL_10275 [Heterostelium album PN500]|eukprot:XP_020428639.1 hypothetical protein PPL_10275 [Heterostelium album PN500]
MGGKKFGTNSKSEEARAKKAEVKRNENEKKVKAKEDAEWAETDSKVIAKEKKRQEEAERKAQEAKRKLENKKALEAEEQDLKQKYGKGKDTAKLTRFEIEQQKERDQKERERQRAALNTSAGGSTTTTTTTTSTTSSGRGGDDDDEDTFDLQENINHVLREQRMKEGGDYHEAREVHDAIKMLSTTTNSEEHPERRMKAAYQAYEEQNLPQLRKENPSLRFTQVKQLLWNQWLKAPENPFNQVQQK